MEFIILQIRDSCSWYEFSKEIFKLSNINIKVNPVSTEEFQTCSRPKYSVLSDEKWINKGF